MKDHFIEMNVKQKVRIKIQKMTNEGRCFLEPDFVGVRKFFVLVYSNQDKYAIRFKTRRYYLPQGIIKN